MLLTNETGVTRAFATALDRTPSLAVAWLHLLGIHATVVTSVTAEELSPRRSDRSGVRRRTDVVIVAVINDEPRTVRIEAKIDAVVDRGQLADAIEIADTVISLVPAEVMSPSHPRAITATWEDVLLLLRRHPDADLVSEFLAHEIEPVINSPRVLSRRRLAQMAPVDVPEEWLVTVGVSTSGGPLVEIEGTPDDTDHCVRVEVSDWEYGKRHRCGRRSWCVARPAAPTRSCGPLSR